MPRWEKQKFLHDPDNGVFGDCYRTCLAGLLQMARDDVPHFVTTMNPDNWQHDVQDKYDAWLSERGWQELAIPLDGGVSVEDVLQWQKDRSPNPSHAYMTGRSRSGCNHCVVIGGGEIIHDPSINGSGIVGPCDDGFYWITWLLRMDRASQEANKDKPKTAFQKAMADSADNMTTVREAGKRWTSTGRTHGGREY